MQGVSHFLNRWHGRGGRHDEDRVTEGFAQKVQAARVSREEEPSYEAACVANPSRDGHQVTGAKLRLQCHGSRQGKYLQWSVGFAKSDKFRNGTKIHIQRFAFALRKI